VFGLKRTVGPRNHHREDFVFLPRRKGRCQERLDLKCPAISLLPPSSMPAQGHKGRKPKKPKREPREPLTASSVKCKGFRSVTKPSSSLSFYLCQEIVGPRRRCFSHPLQDIMGSRNKMWSGCSPFCLPRASPIMYSLFFSPLRFRMQREQDEDYTESRFVKIHAE